MRIPPDAIIPPDKIDRYLLVPRKSNDKSRYLARAGFVPLTAELLRQEIRRMSDSTDASFERDTEHGEFYTVVGSLVGPTGTSLPVKLVWLRRVDGVFSFVTLVPETRSNR